MNTKKECQLLSAKRQTDNADSKAEIRLKKREESKKIRVMDILNIAKEELLDLNAECVRQNAHGQWLVELRNPDGSVREKELWDNDVEIIQYALTHGKDRNRLPDGVAPFQPEALEDFDYEVDRVARIQEVVATIQCQLIGYKNIPHTKNVDYKRKRRKEREARQQEQSYHERLYRFCRENYPDEADKLIQQFREEFLHKPFICLDGEDLELAVKQNRPKKYYRLAVKIVSVVELECWDEMYTVRNFLNKERLTPSKHKKSVPTT